MKLTKGEKIWKEVIEGDKSAYFMDLDDRTITMTQPQMIITGTLLHDAKAGDVVQIKS